MDWLSLERPTIFVLIRDTACFTCIEWLKSLELTMLCRPDLMDQFAVQILLFSRDPKAASLLSNQLNIPIQVIDRIETYSQFHAKPGLVVMAMETNHNLVYLDHLHPDMPTMKHSG